MMYNSPTESWVHPKSKTPKFCIYLLHLTRRLLQSNLADFLNSNDYTNHCLSLKLLLAFSITRHMKQHLSSSNYSPACFEHLLFSYCQLCQRFHPHLSLLPTSGNLSLLQEQWKQYFCTVIIWPAINYCSHSREDMFLHCLGLDGLRIFKYLPPITNSPQDVTPYNVAIWIVEQHFNPLLIIVSIF